MTTDLSREEVLAPFWALYEAGFDVELHARHDRRGLVTGGFPIRAFLQPLDRVQIDKLTTVLDEHGLDFRADSLRSTFANGVWVNVFKKGARSYPV